MSGELEDLRREVPEYRALRPAAMSAIARAVHA